MMYYKKLKECEENLDIFKDKLEYLSYQLDETIKTIRLINQDLAADNKREESERQAEDAYHSAREAEKFRQDHMNDKGKWDFGDINTDYEQAKADQETIADDILRAAGWTKEDLQKGA